jgi:hypothetical protein
MSLLVPWLVFPLVLGVLSLGCGLVLEAVSGRSVPRVLLLPAGFSLIVVAGLVTTSNSATAQFTTPLVVALAVAGFGLSLFRPLARPDGWAAASAVGAFLVYGAPVILSGSATFAGYISLDDTATWLNFTDRLLQHGRTVAGLPTSTFELNLNYYWNQFGYPVGAFPPLGIGHTIVRTDSAWLIQPYHAFMAAMLALGLYQLVGRLIASRPWRALAAFAAAQPALLYGYSLWGGVKEMVTAALFVLVAALTAEAMRRPLSVRGLIPLAVATAALFGVLNFSGGVWLAPLLVPALVVLARAHGRVVIRAVLAFAAVTLLLSIPTLVTAGSFASDITKNSKGGDLGNLLHPLSKLQIFGIWPVGDFRLRPGNVGVTYLLLAVVFASAVLAVTWAWRRREWGLPLYLGAAVVGCALAVAGGSPWIGAKALAVASPALILAGMAGAVWFVRSGRRVEGTVVAVLIAGGVLWSNALAYHGVWLAPRARLAELAHIGQLFRGQGPTLILEDQVYATRHFLGTMAPESPGEYRSRVDPLRSGGTVPTGGYADVDDLALPSVLQYRVLVVNHNPAASRPPSAYQLVFSGRYYDVYELTPGAPRILEHLPLGSAHDAAAAPDCSEVLRLASKAGPSGTLAAVARPPVTAVGAAGTAVTSAWSLVSANPLVVVPHGPGSLVTTVRVPSTGTYGIWIGGSFRGRLEVFVDGRRVATARNRLGLAGDYWPLADVQLTAGAHELRFDYGGASLLPGSGGQPFALGPILLARDTTPSRVIYVPASEARSLCGRRLDWVEALAG